MGVLVVLVVVFVFVPPVGGRVASWSRPLHGSKEIQLSEDEASSDLQPAVGPEEELWSRRAEEVKAEFLYAYHAYETFAFPRDELRPLSKGAIDNYNGWGVSVVDAIDTMVLMGLKDEYQRAVRHVAGIELRRATTALPFFETTIRYLGGFLSAYALTNETIFITKADQLGQELLPAFDTASGLPVFSVNATSGEQANRNGQETVLAEIGTCQLEFKQLAHWTGRAEYFERVDKLSKLMQNTQDEHGGLWGTFWDTATAKQKNDILTVGGTADSAYEYIIKSYLQGAKSDPATRDVFIRAVNGIIENLLYLSPTRHLLYVTDIPSAAVGRPSGKLEHLSCFLPGMIALGAKYLKGEPGFDSDMEELWSWAAQGLGETCWVTYADQASGLGPDEVLFQLWPGNPKDGLWISHVRDWKVRRDGETPPGVKGGVPLRGASGQTDYAMKLNAYQLRPETVESLFVLYKTTGDPKWRDRAWEIFEAIRRHCKVENGYTSVYSLDREEPFKSDAMPSWFLAETLKYLYLIALPQDVLPLDKWVFNTEAHPLPVIHWRDWERERYGIGA
ncbi:hypothetical protein FRB99_002407 [Tulasnella sp. 403]|nr:hypothetical protein FRB99_002407 [Tulasnella sp. 403]